MSNEQVSEDNGDYDDISIDDDNFQYSESVHWKLFLRKAFGINIDGTAIPGIEEINGYPTPEYNCVKSVDQYNEIVPVLTHWGDDTFVKDHPDDPVARENLRFRLRNKKKNFPHNSDVTEYYYYNFPYTPGRVADSTPHVSPTVHPCAVLTRDALPDEDERQGRVAFTCPTRSASHLRRPRRG